MNKETNQMTCLSVFYCVCMCCASTFGCHRKWWTSIVRPFKYRDVINRYRVAAAAAATVAIATYVPLAPPHERTRISVSKQYTFTRLHRFDYKGWARSVSFKLNTKYRQRPTNTLMTLLLSRSHISKHIQPPNFQNESGKFIVHIVNVCDKSLAIIIQKYDHIISALFFNKNLTGRH